MPDIEKCRDFAEMCGQDVNDISEANRRLKAASRLLNRFMEDRQSALIVAISEATAENARQISELTGQVAILTEQVGKPTEALAAENAGQISALTGQVAILTEQVGRLTEALAAKPNPKKDKPSAPPKTDKIPYQEIADAYNEICGGVLPKVVKLTPDRKQKIKSRFDDGFKAEDFKKGFRMAVKSPFLQGENDRKWKASFDFFIQKGQLQKIIEGAYGQDEQNDHSYNLDLILKHSMDTAPKL